VVGIDELRCDADAITAQTRATFQDVTHAKLAANLMHIDPPL
jgi:hypothetical protein